MQSLSDVVVGFFMMLGTFFGFGDANLGANYTTPFKYASTTGISADFICFNSDTCETTWPSSGSSFPTSTNPLMATYMVATSTEKASTFPIASTTNLSVDGNFYANSNIYAGDLSGTGKIVFSSDVNGLLAVDNDLSFSTSGFLFTTINASTTNLSATVFCFIGDICRTTWPTSGSGSWPFTPDTNFGVAVQSTSTPLWLTAGMMASSTAWLSTVHLNGTLNLAATTTGNILAKFGGVSFIMASTTSWSTGFGYGALESAVGINNIRNTAFGYGAGSSTASAADSNTFIGAFAGNKCSNCNDNTFAGSQAGRTITTGSNNSAFGSQAMPAVTTGGSNFAMGAISLSSLTTGNNNVGFGNQTLINLVSANENSALGNSACRTVTGAANICVGIRSGSQATASAGYGNIIIGGYNTTAHDVITTGDNNIGIGNNAFFESKTNNNQLNIGGLIFGTLPATSTSFTLPTSGAIGIGTSSPFARFAIHLNNGGTHAFAFEIASSTASATTTLFSVKNNGRINLGAAYTPASGSADCIAGDIAWDADFFYVCTAANAWERTALTAF